MERGRSNLEESIENHWPQLLHVSDKQCQIDCFPCFAAYFSSFPKENAFQNLEETLWTINQKTEFPDFSLTLTINYIKDFPWLFPYLEKFRFPWVFCDHSNPVTTVCSPASLISSMDRALCPANVKVRIWFPAKTKIISFHTGFFFSNALVVHSTPTIMFTFLDNLNRKSGICCRQAWNLVQKMHRKLIPQYVTLLQQR